MNKVTNYDATLKVEIVYKILEPIEAEVIASHKHTVSVQEYRRIVVETVVENLKTVVASKLAALSKDQARRASDNLFRAAIMLNPQLDVAAKPESVLPLDARKVKNLEKNLLKKVVGQEEAVKKLVARIKQSAVGLTNEGKPRGVFLFAGPSGSGKTLLAKTLQEELFPGTRIIRVDCSEYADAHNRSRILGAPPSYVGYDQGGQLTEEIKMRPNTVLLLDEVEKAHPTLFDLFLQVFDEGFLTDAKGERADFTGTIIIMTSNIGTQSLGTRSIGFNSTPTLYKGMKQDVLAQVNQHFRVEFLGRIDESVIFQPLNASHLSQIAKMQLVELKEQANDKGISLSWGPKVVSWLVQKAHTSLYGAREIAQVISRNIRHPLAEIMLNQRKSCDIQVEVLGGDINLRIGKTPARGQMKKTER